MLGVALGGGNSFLFRWVEVMCLLSYAAVSHSAVCYYAQRTQSREEHRSDAWGIDALMSLGLDGLKILKSENSHLRSFAIVEALTLSYESMLDRCMQVFDVQRDSDCTTWLSRWRNGVVLGHLLYLHLGSAAVACVTARQLISLHYFIFWAFPMSVWHGSFLDDVCFIRQLGKHWWLQNRTRWRCMFH